MVFKVLYFAGENPDDVRTRWIKLCDELKKAPDEMDVVFLAGTPNIANELIRRAIENEAFDYGEFSLLIIDTAAAYFPGDNENDNKQLGDFARELRKYVELKGGPTILITCHPKKILIPPICYRVAAARF